MLFMEKFILAHPLKRYRRPHHIYPCLRDLSVLVGYFGYFLGTLRNGELSCYLFISWHFFSTSGSFSACFHQSFRRTKRFPWQQDLFEESLRAAGISGIEIGTKLYVSNLHYGVTNEDIRVQLEPYNFILSAFNNKFHVSICWNLALQLRNFSLRSESWSDMQFILIKMADQVWVLVLRIVNSSFYFLSCFFFVFFFPSWLMVLLWGGWHWYWNLFGITNINYNFNFLDWSNKQYAIISCLIPNHCYRVGDFCYQKSDNSFLRTLYLFGSISINFIIR